MATVKKRVASHPCHRELYELLAAERTVTKRVLNSYDFCSFTQEVCHVSIFNHPVAVFFYFYCFVGWCIESTHVSIRTRKLTNRGFMRGPFLPLYGSGAIMMLVVSMPFRDSIVLTYLAGCVGATILEYITGVTMEALFKVRYWDYSNQKFNFQGHICLGTTFAWGLLTILMTEIVHVPVEKLMLSIPGRILTVVTIVLTIVIAVDFALSFKAAIDLRDILVRMEQVKQELLHIQKNLDAIFAAANAEWESRKGGMGKP